MRVALHLDFKLGHKLALFLLSVLGISPHIKIVLQFLVLLFLRFVPLPIQPHCALPQSIAQNPDVSVWILVELSRVLEYVS